jgi:pimeloyl-ACP methyl ester carboxylesterase
MSDHTGGPGPAFGAPTTPVPPRKPGLIRSLAHRLAGERPALPDEGRLASFDGATGWLNSPPLTPEGLRGRVVLVDFWTYTCVNWLRTLPSVRAWAAKYAAAGLTVVGVHTTEFGSEHDADNVTAAARTLDVGYLIALDDDYAAGYATYRRDFARLIWRLASPRWAFDDATFDRSAAALDNPDHVDIVVHNYRWRLGLAEGEPECADLEARLAAGPAIAVPTITLEGDANGAPHPEAGACAGKFSGRYAHRIITGGVGHNLPQEAPQAFAQAVVDADGW